MVCGCRSSSLVCTITINSRRRFEGVQFFLGSRLEALSSCCTQIPVVPTDGRSSYERGFHVTAVVRIEGGILQWQIIITRLKSLAAFNPCLTRLKRLNYHMRMIQGVRSRCWPFAGPSSCKRCVCVRRRFLRMCFAFVLFFVDLVVGTPVLKTGRRRTLDLVNHVRVGGRHEATAVAPRLDRL